jgi:hypothetical protein
MTTDVQTAWDNETTIEWAGHLEALSNDYIAKKEKADASMGQARLDAKEARKAILKVQQALNDRKAWREKRRMPLFEQAGVRVPLDAPKGSGAATARACRVCGTQPGQVEDDGTWAEPTLCPTCTGHDGGELHPARITQSACDAAYVAAVVVNATPDGKPPRVCPIKLGREQRNHAGLLCELWVLTNDRTGPDGKKLWIGLPLWPLKTFGKAHRGVPSRPHPGGPDYYAGVLVRHGNAHLCLGTRNEQRIFKVSP